MAGLSASAFAATADAPGSGPLAGLAQAYVARIDGKTVWSQRATQKLAPASLTKVMGDSQQVTVGTTAPLPLVVEVQAADGLLQPGRVIAEGLQRVELEIRSDQLLPLKCELGADTADGQLVGRPDQAIDLVGQQLFFRAEQPVH